MILQKFNLYCGFAQPRLKCEPVINMLHLHSMSLVLTDLGEKTVRLCFHFYACPSMELCNEKKMRSTRILLSEFNSVFQTNKLFKTGSVQLHSF